jgi:hypothetical protein
MPASMRPCEVGVVAAAAPASHSESRSVGVEGPRKTLRAAAREGSRCPGHPRCQRVAKRTVPSASLVDWDSLTPRADWILYNVATPLSLGWPLVEVARSLNMTKTAADALLDELADELEQRCGE